MRTILLFTAASLALAAPCSAFADDDPLVITATRAPSAAENLPADITIIDVDVSLARGETTLVEALQNTPGLGAVQSGGAGQQTSVFSGGANSNHTLVLFDGLRINDPSTPGSSFDAGQDQLSALERIEIVEGPMSAVFGSDAVGGVVNMIPRHGGDGALNARLDMSTGSFGTVQGAAGVDGTLGHFRYALTAEGYATDGYDLVPERIVTHTGDRDGAEMSAITGVFDLALTDAIILDSLVRIRQAHADFDGLAYEFAPPFREYRIDDPDLEIAKNDLTVARLGATWTLSDTLSLRATYGGIRQERAQTDGGQVTDAYKGDRRFGDLTLDWRGGSIGAVQDITIVAGLSAEREEIDAAQGFGFPPPSVFLSADQDQSSAFVTAQGRVAALTLTSAVRVDDYEGFGTQTTWRLGGSYAVSSNARLYAAYGTSFRAPTLYERFASFGDPNLNPEQGESWEAGGDLRLRAFGADDRLTLGALYRHTEIQDLIDFGTFTYANVDEAEMDVAEAHVTARPLPWLTLRAAYTYTDAQDVIARAQLLRRPEDAWLLSAEVVQGPFTSRLSWRSVGQRRDIVYGDDSFSIGAANTPAYDLARLSLAWRFSPNAETYLVADNAFDETYEPVNGYAGAPRAVSVGLRLRAGS